MIPQVEPYISNDDIEWVHQYMRSGGWITEFKETKKFEEELAGTLDVAHCTVCTSGTAGLFLALKACGIGPRHKVLVPNFTMFASIAAIEMVGATPILADVAVDNLCLDLDKVTDFVDAVVYVSINGRSDPDVADKIKSLQDRGIVVIEDACQSFGSIAGADYLGTMGNAGVFSFSPHKIITTGQGGAVVTNDINVHERAAKLKDFGRCVSGIDLHESIGYNFKFTDLQAVLGRSQLKNLTHRLSRKREIYKQYVSQLQGLPVRILEHQPYGGLWFVDVLFASQKTRDGVAAQLKQVGIGTRPFYPSLSQQPVYAGAYKDCEFPVSINASACGLWLPSSVRLKNYEITAVCDCIRHFLESKND